jgi:rfaE bifunctional protein kinase chain/domain
MTYNSDIFDSFSKLNVLIIGDVMIDRYLEGAVSRISPEAPVPVVRLARSDNRLGGAANVALNIKALGGTAYLCSMVGKDEAGDQFLDLLPKNGLSNRYILQSAERKTTVKTRILANSQQLLRVDSEDTHDLIEKEANQVLGTVKDLLDHKDIHVILFQDYNKGVLSRKIINEIMLESIKRDIPTAVDPKFENFWAYKHVTLFKPNLKEIRAQIATDINADDLSSLSRTAEEVRSRLGNQLTLITLSEKGLFIDDSGEGHIVPTQPRVIADVCGAGDTVISIAAMGLALKMDAKELAVLANLSGGQVCERVGVAPVDLEQLKLEYQVLVER